MAQSIYNWPAKELADLFEPMLRQGVVDYLFSSDELPLRAGLEMTDGCDGQRLSQAMAVLKRRRLVRYRRSYRQWENSVHPRVTGVVPG